MLSGKGTVDRDQSLGTIDYSLAPILTMDGQLIYTFLSPAMTHNGATPLEGMCFTAKLAHRYGIPVTWVVDSQSVQDSKDIISQGHQEYGDDVILMIDISHVLAEASFSTPRSKAEEVVILRQRLPGFVTSEQEKLRGVLPWSEVNVIAADVKTEVLVEVLEELGCIGLWGYRWEDNRSEGESDRGCPWSFFYASREHYNAPAQYAGRMVAVENTSFDLNAVFYSGNTAVFSAKPGNLRLSGLCADENLDYTKALLNEYLKNCSWNRFVTFVQNQPAHEMGHDREAADKISGIMRDFFREVVSNPGIKALTLPQAIELYKREFEYTESCCMEFDGVVPLHVDINFYVPPVPKQKPPYLSTFFYYDRECYFVFREGEMTPVEMRNYAHPPFESRYYVEREMPTISSFRPYRDRDKLIMEFEIESAKQMPFGLVIWDDHSMFSLVSTNARLVKWIGNYLLFIRVDLEEGLNRIEVTLAI